MIMTVQIDPGVRLKADSEVLTVAAGRVAERQSEYAIYTAR